MVKRALNAINVHYVFCSRYGVIYSPKNKHKRPNKILRLHAHARVEGNSNWTNLFNWFVAHVSQSVPQGKPY